MALAALVAGVIVLAVTGPHLVHLYDTVVATCATHGDCSTATSSFLRNDRSLQIGLDVLVVVVPGIIGMFWGAPLVARELEAGTFRLVWTQSVTRSRWLAIKLGLVGLAAMVTAGLLSLMATWWSSPVDRVNMSVFTSFEQRDVVPIGYAAFAFALGVTAGVLIRRTLPAMATTLAVFVAVRLAVTHWIRPHLIAPALRYFALNPTNIGFGSANGGPSTLQTNPPDISNAWIYSSQIVDKAGHPLAASFVASACPGLGAGRSPLGGPPPGLQPSRIPAPAGAQQALQDCLTKVGATFHELVTYQPSSRYWTFQWYELAIYLGAAVVLSGLCLWWVRHRLA